MEEAGEEIRKKKNGQTGADGNAYLRTRRIELRVCQHEYQQIAQHAESSGYANLAQYLRESGLSRKNIESPSRRQKERQRILYEQNRIGNNLNQLARRCNSGSAFDEEALMILLQIREMVDETHSATLKSLNKESA